jgi:hypothetical protein
MICFITKVFHMMTTSTHRGIEVLQKALKEERETLSEDAAEDLADWNRIAIAFDKS